MISVCMATYNGEKYIAAQLESILPQLSPEDEVIISDDSSTDGTLRAVIALNDARIVVVPHQKFKSPIFNFENALRHAKGDFIFLSDQDDLWLPGRVAKMMNALQNNDLVVSDCKVVDDNLKVVQNSYFKMVNAQPGFIRNFVRTSPYIGCCMAFNQKVRNVALPFPRQIPMHDFWIAMLSEAKFRIQFVDEPLLLYRRHATNASATAAKSKNSFVRKISFRINTFLPLLTRLLR